jgi:glycosyltransferase involved in cell wall biosynthesis
MFQFTFQMFPFIEKIFNIFSMIYNNLFGYLYPGKLYEVFIKNLMKRVWMSRMAAAENEEKNNTVMKKKIRVGLLTNEIPPIVYGGVATWIVNFIKMFDDDENIEIIPIFLAYNDKLPEDCLKKYKNIRVIDTEEDIEGCFDDIDVCVNNLWIALETIQKIKELFPDMNIVSVCHSLIRMENITNLGSCYTNNFNQQEVTFQNSDYVVLISQAEEDYYNVFGYNLFDTKTKVIYNSYEPKYDDETLDVDYTSNTLGYIGRHVPRKRPEIPIVSVNKHKIEGVNVVNMGVDYDKYDNAYWRVLEKKYSENLRIIPFTCDKNVKEQYWKDIGINCITGIYEPFGYTICECLDRRVPVIVSNIDGPKEIVEEVINNVYTYEVDVDDYPKDIDNFTDALKKVMDTPSAVRKENAEKARKALDKLRPENIKKEWIVLFNEIF